MKRNSEQGFTLLELVVSTGCLLAVLTGALWFFSRSQVIHTNERASLDMVQDLRTVFNRFTNEIRMAGAGLPGYHGVVSGTAQSLIVRGDFANIEAIVTSLSPASGGILPVSVTDGFIVGQTISLLDTDGPTAGASALAKIIAVDATAGTITIEAEDLLPITSGAEISNFGPGCIINVVERRTYGIIASGPHAGSITRTCAYESTQTPGGAVQPQETIASHVLTPEGEPGLRFIYYDAADNVLPFDPNTGVVDSTRVTKVEVNLRARTRERDLSNGQYRTMQITALIQVRGQYIPAVGF